MKLSLLICMAFACLTNAGAADPKPITVKAGQELKLTLHAKATTGCRWVLAKATDEKLVKLLGSEYKRLDSKLMGAGGDMVWTFETLAEGKAEIRLDYIRPWERGVKQIGRASCRE